MKITLNSLNYTSRVRSTETSGCLIKYNFWSQKLVNVFNLKRNMRWYEKFKVILINKERSF